MKFALMGYELDGEWERLPESERKRRVQNHQFHLNELVVRRGIAAHGRVLIASVGLQTGPGAATTLRFGGGKHPITDGPFAETREVLAGFDLVEFDSLDEAVALASKYFTHDGHIGVIRPVREMWWVQHRAGDSDAMKFALLLRGDETAWNRESPDARERNIRSHEQIGMEYTARKSVRADETFGYGGIALTPGAGATTLRRRAGEVIVSDGPFAETREVIGGVILLECASKIEAAEWAKRYVTRESDFVELWPVSSSWFIYHD